MQKPLGRNTVVLLGVGHTNAHVLRMWKMKPIRDAQLVCVSDFPIATYSGMLPGVISGQYNRSAMEIDLVRLSQAAGARLVIGNVVGLDPQASGIDLWRSSTAGIRCSVDWNRFPAEPTRSVNFRRRPTDRCQTHANVFGSVACDVDCHW